MELIFIIGAARSGTHLVGGSLHCSLNDSMYIAEINDFWMRFSKNRKVDYINATDFSDAEISKIREEFFALTDGSNCIIEKTAANSLRVGLLARTFPEAKFIHIIRNGSDVIESVSKKVNGDPRKITSDHSIKHLSVVGKVKFVITRLKEKFKSGSFNLKHYLLNFEYYLRVLFSIFGLKTKNNWGPRFTTDKSVINLPTKKYMALQWEACVSKSQQELSDSSVSFIEVRFEELMEKPNFVSKLISDFLGSNPITFNINHNVSIISSITKHTDVGCEVFDRKLKELGYE